MFSQHDPLAGLLGLPQGQGNAGGLARSRGCLQQHSGASNEGLHDRRQMAIDRQGQAGDGGIAGTQRTCRTPSTGWYASPVVSS